MAVLMTRHPERSALVAGRGVDHAGPGPALRSSGRRLVNLHLDAQILAHDVLEMPGGSLEHLEPAVLPVANAGEPRRAAAARPRLRTSSLEVQPALLGEGLAVPDLLDRHVVDVPKELGGAERDVLPAQGHPPEGVHVEPLEGPDARLLPLRREMAVEVRVESAAE